MLGVTTTLEASSPWAAAMALTAVAISVVEMEPWMVVSVGETVARENWIVVGRNDSRSEMVWDGWGGGMLELFGGSGVPGERAHLEEVQVHLNLFVCDLEIGAEVDVALTHQLRGGDALERGDRHVVCRAGGVPDACKLGVSARSGGAGVEGSGVQHTPHLSAGDGHDGAYGNRVSGGSSIASGGWGGGANLCGQTWARL